MKNLIYPCLWFDKQGKEAADYYCSIFPNSKITTDTPLVVNFELNGLKIMGLNGGPLFTINPSISFFVICHTKQETDQIWNKLLIDGKVMMPIDTYPWSERYGWLQDKFGLTWQISLAKKEDFKKPITPALLFTGTQFGRAEEAIKLYTSVFKNSMVSTLQHYEEKEHGPGKVLYAEFQLDDHDFIIMDGPGNHDFAFNEALSFVVDCDTQDEIDYFWERLIAEGGKESQCGWLKDKFGVSWQIVPTVLRKLMSDPSRAQRAIAAFMKMKKFDIEKLLNA